MKASTKVRAVCGTMRGRRGPVQRREMRLWRCATLGLNEKPLPPNMAAKRSYRKAHRQGVKMRKVLYGPAEGLEKMIRHSESMLRAVLVGGVIPMVALAKFVTKRTAQSVKLKGIST